MPKRNFRLEPTEQDYEDFADNAEICIVDAVTHAEQDGFAHKTIEDWVFKYCAESAITTVDHLIEDIRARGK